MKVKGYKDVMRLGGEVKGYLLRLSGSDFECVSCGVEVNPTTSKSNRLWANVYVPEGRKESAKAAVQDFLDRDRNVSGVSDWTASDSMQDKDGNRATVTFTCPGCNAQYASHNERKFGGYG